MIQRIKSLTAAVIPQVKQIREHIHKNPELSFQEVNTVRFVEDTLRSWGISSIKPIANTGLIVLIEGKNPTKKVIGLRCELDALPIVEKSQEAYCSINEGVMHACGHDVHTACLLGAAKILHDTKEEWEGTIKLFIQPGEEKEPGGASVLIKEGALENPRPECVIAQHVYPNLPAGTVGFREGLYMASADEIHMTIKGKGGHGALPQTVIDPVLIGSHIIVALQQIVSRNAYPIIPSVLSFGKFIANGATNVIPDEVHIAGTFRTMDETWRKKAHENMINIAKGIAEGMGASLDIQISKGYPCLVNDPKVTSNCRNIAKEYLGNEQVKELDLRMTAEDFAFFGHEIPICYYRLGTSSADGRFTAPVHTPSFDISADAYETGVGLMTYIAWSHLQD